MCKHRTRERKEKKRNFFHDFQSSTLKSSKKLLMKIALHKKKWSKKMKGKKNFFQKITSFFSSDVIAVWRTGRKIFLLIISLLYDFFLFMQGGGGALRGIFFLFSPSLRSMKYLEIMRNAQNVQGKYFWDTKY